MKAIRSSHLLDVALLLHFVGTLILILRCVDRLANFFLHCITLIDQGLSALNFIHGLTLLLRHLLAFVSAFRLEEAHARITRIQLLDQLALLH